MTAHVNDTGREELRDDLIVSWHLDPGLTFRSSGHGIERSEDPLLISTVGAWWNRPDASTEIPNLMLAADYVRVSIDTATMEGANHAGRLAANALLAATGSGERAPVFNLYQPPEWEPLRRADAARYKAGQPNV